MSFFCVNCVPLIGDLFLDIKLQTRLVNCVSHKERIKVDFQMKKIYIDYRVQTYNTCTHAQAKISFS